MLSDSEDLFVFPSDEIHLDLPQEWYDALWINHSDIPNEKHPNSFRCDTELSCTHNYTWVGEDEFPLSQEEGGIWQPVLAEYNIGFVQWEVDPVDLETKKYRSFIRGHMREVEIGRCPVCGKVHYRVERMNDEWFNLEL
jgi:hypothetical protein